MTDERWDRRHEELKVKASTKPNFEAIQHESRSDGSHKAQNRFYDAQHWEHVLGATQTAGNMLIPSHRWQLEIAFWLKGNSNISPTVTLNNVWGFSLAAIDREHHVLRRMRMVLLEHLHIKSI